MIKSICLQIIFLLLLVLIPILWFNFSNYLSENNYMIFLGLFLMVESYIYIKLPLDLIPDFIPLIGKLDDFIAYLIGLFGFWIVIYMIYYNISEYLILLTDAITYK